MADNHSNKIGNITQHINVQNKKNKDKSNERKLGKTLKNRNSEKKKVKINDIMSDSTLSEEEMENELSNISSMREEMTKKDMEIKKLKEQLQEMTMQSMRETSEKMNVLILNELISEVKFAEAFLRTIMSETIFHLVSISNKNESYEAAKKAMEDIKLIDINKRHMSTCICDLCLANKSINYVSSERKIKKKVPITENIYLEMVYKPRFFEFRTDNSRSEEKAIVFEDMEGKNRDVRVKVKKENNDYLKDMNIKDFQKSMIPFKMSTLGKTLNLSLSSMIIAVAMRNMENSNYYDMMDMKNLSEFDILRASESCFKKFFIRATNLSSDIMSMESLEGRKMNSISDLTMEEEALLLTNCKDEYVFIRKISNDNLKNHIDFNDFEGAVKTKILYLVTPEMRNVMFYSNSELKEFENEDDMEIIDYPGNTMEKEDMNPADTVFKTYNMMMTEGIDAFLAKDGSLVLETKISKFLNHFYQATTDNENLEQFKKWFWNMGENSTVLNSLSKSLMSSDATENYVTKLEPLFLFNMTFKHFCVLAFFWSDYNDFFNHIVDGNLTELRQTLNMLPSYFAYMKMKDYPYYKDIAAGDMFKEIQMCIDKISELDIFENPKFNYLYKFMKFKCYMKIIMAQNFATSMINEEADLSKKLNKDLDDGGSFLIMNAKKKYHMTEMRPINTFQPTKDFIHVLSKDEMTKFKVTMINEFQKEEEKELIVDMHSISELIYTTGI